MRKLSTHWLSEEMTYTGNELRSHFIYDKTDLLGDAIVGFVGPCKVDLTEMVDLEDVKKKAPIYSEKMLHFLIELFETPLSSLVFYQRLLIVTIKDEILHRLPTLFLNRKGDDLYEGIYKLNVSIATITPVSGVIHAGINISSRHTPVPTKGLEDYQIDPVEVGQSVLTNYVQEVESSWRAASKVRGVK